MINTPAFLVEYIYLLKKKPRAVVVYGICYFLIHISLVILPVLLGYGLKLAIYGLLACSMIRFFWLTVLLVKYAKFRIMPVIIRRHLGCAWPLILAVLFSGSADYIDGFIAGKFFDNASFALFRYGAREFPLSMILANALSVSMISTVAANSAEACSAIRRKSGKLMHILFPLSAVFIILSHQLFEIFFSVEFMLSADIFNIYLLLVVSRLVFPQTLFMGMGKPRLLMYVSLGEVLLNVASSLLFMNYFGLIGIALGTLTAFYFEKMVLMYFSFSILKIPPDKYIPIRIFVFYSLLVWIVYILDTIIL